MKHTKEQRRSYLFDEIGRVDDALLFDALTYKRRKRPNVTALSAIAAALLVTVMSASLLWDRFRPLPGGDAPSYSDGSGNGANEPSISKPTLDVLLESGVAYQTLSSAAEVDYFGDAHLVWQKAGDQTLSRSRPMTADEVETLLSMMKASASVGASSPTLLCRVWLVSGNGEVLTPYLPHTSGNVGAAVLFDYEAELLPSEELIAFISGILA